VKALGQPVEGHYNLALKAPNGVFRLPRSATLADLGLLSGMTLMLQVEENIYDQPAESAAFLHGERGERLKADQEQELQEGDVVEFGKAEKGGVRLTFSRKE
jgi:hypothetical protein